MRPKHNFSSGFTSHQFPMQRGLPDNIIQPIKHHKTGAGFTLIELLVVIAIIGVLASVVLVSLNSARMKARNARRAADLHQIQQALEMYYDVNNGYPNPGWAWRSECNGWGGLSSDQVIPGLVPTYMSKFPADPSMNKSASTACYLYYSNGTEYKLLDHDIASAESSGFTYNAFPNLIDPARDSGSDPCKVDGSGIWSWAVYTNNQPCNPNGTPPTGGGYW